MGLALRSSHMTERNTVSAMEMEISASLPQGIKGQQKPAALRVAPKLTRAQPKGHGQQQGPQCDGPLHRLDVRHGVIKRGWRNSTCGESSGTLEGHRPPNHQPHSPGAADQA
jgi:hypothetical protein